MPKYVIERDLPGVGQMSPEELRGVSQKSNEVLRDLGPDAQWVQSYVVEDKLYCVYNATGEDVIREHARRGGFPCTTVSRVGTVIDPTTAEA